MIFYHDTRDKQGKHENVDNYLLKHGHEIVYRKLDVGDIMVEGIPSIAIDLKRNLGELSKNLMNREDHSRFYKEVRRSRQSGIKLYILCEHGGKIKSIQDVARWSDKYSGVSGRRLIDEIYRIQISYGVKFVFCDKSETGMRIIEILKGGDLNA